MKMDMIIRRTRISDEQPLMDIGIADGRIVLSFFLPLFSNTGWL